MAESITASPLCWPMGKSRTLAEDRKRGRFGKRNASGWGLQELSVSEARGRVIEVLDRFTKPGQPYRVPSDTIVLSTNLSLRNDGMPRSGQREPTDPGVAVYFKLDGRQQCIPCDVYTRVADNIAAVADCLESLRTLERHDAQLMQAAFTGFAQLASPEASGRALWREVLSTNSNDLDEIRQAYRRAIKRAHPDHGGSSEQFAAVQQAWAKAQEEIGND
ncbi:J domain-containing protein [Kushneria phosphatilytica]|uniref:J domain-containing protein n=1 Tax=Kushneria phosphatilytica TaxID=657387 RepID=A0A1S1NZ12_9GAMM|nr:J domain-containing protein [Kushneria phosphatilytica]OHV12972.1 hypothetical protein BH688_02930 [Kushneria phosphatilytica]QEL10841.1 J domain-containing protein [Kushneria phosphatilytica]